MEDFVNSINWAPALGHALYIQNNKFVPVITIYILQQRHWGWPRYGNCPQVTWEVNNLVGMGTQVCLMLKPCFSCSSVVLFWTLCWARMWPGPPLRMASISMHWDKPLEEFSSYILGSLVWLRRMLSTNKCIQRIKTEIMMNTELISSKAARESASCLSWEGRAVRA